MPHIAPIIWTALYLTMVVIITKLFLKLTLITVQL